MARHDPNSVTLMGQFSQPDVIVIGAGVAGISAALYLQRSGRNVLVLDPCEPGSVTSYGNAGLISAATAVPMAMPGMLKNVPRWLMDPEGPLMLKPGHLPRALPWLMRWIAASRWSNVLRISDAMHALHSQTFECWGELVGRETAHRLISRTGQVRISRLSPVKPMEAALFARQSTNAELLTSQQLKQIYPDLNSEGWTGVHIKDNGHTINPKALVDALTLEFHRSGGTVLPERVTNIAKAYSGYDIVTHATIRRTPRVVIACGIWSKDLLRQMGIQVPLESERGYHAMVPSEGQRIPVPLMVKDDGFVLTTMENGIRIAGTVELAGIDSPPSDKRPSTLVKKARQLFSSLNEEISSSWMGHRPSTPDSLPVVGEFPHHPGLFGMFGHGHFGMTTSPPSAKLLRDLVNNQSTSLDPAPYRAGRFY